MYGNLFLYDNKNKLVAFESGAISSPQCLILIGGLTDGLLSLPYADKLSTTLATLDRQYSLVQPLFRSSNLQYGWHTVNHDIEDLHTLIDYLILNRNNLKSIILMGHSTGCQDIIHYLRIGNIHKIIDKVILQAPVSDREYLSRLPSTKIQLDYCLENQSKSTEWLPRHLHDPPLTIERCLSLNQRNSIEDVFSSDLTDDEIKAIYQNIDIPIIWIWSMQDEYVPMDIKDNVYHFIKNKLSKRNNSIFISLENADHAVTTDQDQIYMIEQIIQHIVDENTKR